MKKTGISVITALIVMLTYFWFKYQWRLKLMNKATEIISRIGKLVNDPVVRSDSAGDGHFGASRSGGTRTHKGVDLLVEPGEAIFAPFPGKVVREARPYDSDDHYTGLLLEGSGAFEGYALKLFYMEPLEGIIGREVTQGALIGHAQAISEKHGGGMMDHVHAEIYIGDKLTNPEPFLIT